MRTDWAINHNQKLDLAMLRDRYGPDAAAMADDIIPKLKCAKCGSKRVGVIHTRHDTDSLCEGEGAMTDKPADSATTSLSR
ncbi:MAG: hypothetical protein E5V24_11375 [Mesorhizobium sp.]|nr:MAG: hypothetical protein E5V24_11375 [Mesorhizobium sp.]